MNQVLPDNVEPLVLADGTIINPMNGSVVEDKSSLLVEVPNASAAQREIVAQRKRLTDLPIPPKQMNVVSVILTYSLLGITDEEIASQIGTTTDRVGAIKMSDVYKEVMNQCVNSIVESDKDAVRNLFVVASRTAASKMTSLLDSKHVDIQLRAAQDILDRAGHRPADIHEHRHTIEGGLRIEYTTKKEKQIPTLDMTLDGEF